VVDPDDIEMLEDLVVAAVSEALRASQELQSNSMGSVTGGIDLSAFGLG
jgi:DNA-binding protein YbaB